MTAPLVLIIANPYEGEMCRRALGDIGVRLEVAEGGEGARELLDGDKPLVIVVADGLFSEDAKELCYVARQRFADVPIFLLADREGIAGVTVQRTFLRPVATEELAHAVEKLAVAAETAELEELDSDALEIDAAFDDELVVKAPPAPSAPPVVDEEDDAADEWNVPVDGWETPSAIRLIKLPKSRTELVEVQRVTELASPTDTARLDELMGSDALGEPPASITIGQVRINEPLLRADEALRDPADMVPRRTEKLDAFNPSLMQTLTAAPAPEPIPATRPPLSSLRRLDQDLSAAERRLFPDASPSAQAYPDDESLGDIDLDALGVEMPARSRPTDGAHEPPRPADDAPAKRVTAAGRAPATLDELVENEGALGELDIVELLARLHAAGFTGRVTLTRSDGQKSLFFDGGTPVAAASTLTHDRLGDLLYREGKLTREQHALTREVEAGGGRQGAQALVELGVLKAGELFAALRRQTEEIWYSLFTPTWDHAAYRLSTEQAGADDKLRLSAHSFALLTEGVRRKYGLERLVERLGPPEMVLTPTARFGEVLDEMALTPAEKLAAELIDGHRSLGEIRLAVGGLPTLALSEGGLYALAWVLWCIAAVRVGEATSPLDGPTWHNAGDGENGKSEPERRRALRAESERPEDRAVDRERIRAKWQQLGDCDYFAALGVDRDATEHEILRAYERLRQDFAPQRFVEPLRVELAPAFEEIAEVLDEARRVLLDAPLRHTYRSQLMAGS